MNTNEQIRDLLRRVDEAEARAQRQVNEAEARARAAEARERAAEARARQQVNAAEARERAAEARVRAAEARVVTEQRQREEAEKAVAPTDFHTFLSLTHDNLYSNLTIQEDPELSAAGTYTNVDSKCYPLHLKLWADFPSLHKQCHARLESLFHNKNVFPSVEGLSTVNEMLSLNEPLADENDMRLVQFVNVESCARRVLFQYLKESRAEPSPTNTSDDSSNDDEDKECAALPLRVYFSNTPHGILLDGPDDNDESQHSDTTPAYQPAMLEAQQKDADARGRATGDGPPPPKRMTSPVRKFHPDQWFMRINGDGTIMPVFVVEYKAAHKLRGSTLKLALSNTTRDPQGLFAAAVREQMRNKVYQDEDLKKRVNAEKATARVIAQAFHYMVEFGLCYSYVASGEALILLYFDAADVRTLYYHLALPQEEVGSDAAEDVQRSSVSLVTTMALLALDGPVLSQRWKKDAMAVLERWPTPYDEMGLVDDSSEEEDARKLKDVPKLASRQSQQTCNEDTAPQKSRRKDDDDDGNDRDFPPPRPSQAHAALTGKSYATRSKGASTTHSSTTNTNSTTRQHKALPYCSQACILGLRNGGPLDGKCPNVQLHAPTADGCHQFTAVQFCEQLRQQLACDLDEDCEALDKYGKYGAIGMLFRLTLRGYGYCVVAKGVQRVHAALLKQEMAVYQHLQEQQGTLVPVCLGIVNLVDVYRTSYGAHVAHMMVMSYAGERIYSKAAGPMPDNICSLEYDAWVRLRQLGLEHGDEREPNLLWNAAEQQLMCIDFERSEIITRKRKFKKETRPDSQPPKESWMTAQPQKHSFLADGP